jgi:hypothetical protein
MFTTGSQAIWRGVPGSGVVPMRLSELPKTAIPPPVAGKAPGFPGCGPTGTQIWVSAPDPWTMTGPMGAEFGCIGSFPEAGRSVVGSRTFTAPARTSVASTYAGVLSTFGR